MWKLMKTKQIGEAKPLYSELLIARDFATATCILAESQRQTRVGKLYSGEKGRLQVCLGWRLLAWGNYKRVGN